MRIAIFSDIHANPDAIETAFRDAQDKRSAERSFCLGDVVGYGYDPIGSIECVRNKCEVCVIGNHDAGMVSKLGLDWFSDTAKNGILRQRKDVENDPKSAEWLRSLPYTHKIEDNGLVCEFAHGTNYMPEDFDYITCAGDSKAAFSTLKEHGSDILFVGHTHESLLIWQKKCDEKDWYRNYPDYEYVNRNKKFDLHDGFRYIYNPGSVGYPRVQERIGYCVLDTVERTIEQIFLEFDYKQYLVKMNERSIPIPRWLEWRTRT